MPLLASEVMDRSAAFLSDPDKYLFTYTLQLPFLKQANDELGDEITNEGIEIDRMVADDIAVAANAVTLTLPNDFILPISLLEKQSGQSDSFYVPMIERKWQENLVASTYHQFWSFRDHQIHFPASINATVIQLNYLRIIAPVDTSNSELETERAMRFLAARTAELCASMIGSNEELSDKIKIKYADPALDALLRQFTKNAQGVSVRRKGFKRRRFVMMSGS